MSRCKAWVEASGHPTFMRPCVAHAMKDSGFCRAHTPKPKAPDPKALYVISNGRLGSPINFPAADSVRIVTPDGKWLEVKWQNWDNQFQVRASNAMLIELNVSNLINITIKE
jgi:hypothetical protein